MTEDTITMTTTNTRRRRGWTRCVAPLAIGALGLAAAACGGDEVDGSASAVEGPTIVIGSQDFGESLILAEVYAQALTHAGYDVQLQALGGFRDLVFTSFDSGDINFTPEYAASALEFLNGFAGEASSDITDTADKLRTQLAQRGLVALAPSPAVDSNSFVVTAETAERLGLSSVSDLTDDLRLGAPPDCADNASCLPGLASVYGLDLSANYIPLDGGGPLTVAALEGGEIDVGVLFSTDGVIADKGWVVLQDDLGLINADNIIAIVTDELIEVYGADFVALVDAVGLALDTAQLTELNRLYGIELDDADNVARQWLTSAGFLS
jgi:osmoprotectant transport system substrate-binding protein